MSSLRYIKSFTSENRTTKVYYDADWEEYVVRLYVDNAVCSAATYHTTDLDDAEGSARVMIQ